MELEKITNAGLVVLKVLRQMKDSDGRVLIDQHEICRRAGISSNALRECLDDLERLKFLSIEVTAELAKEWR